MCSNPKGLVNDPKIYNNGKDMKLQTRSEQGQILLITLLVLTVATTVALSLIGRATLDLSISNQLEESSRAFSAAEAGVELALKSGAGSNGPQVLTPGITYDVTVNPIGVTSGLSNIYTISHQTSRDSTETVWLVNHSDPTTITETPTYTNNTITVCWSQAATPTGLAISVLYKTPLGAYNVARAGFDPSAASRNNGFDATGISVSGCNQSWYSKVLDFTALGITPATDTIIALRMRPVYADATIAVDGGTQALPNQGSVIESTGQTGSGVTRKVVVYKQYRAPLSVFDSVIYSQSAFGH